MLNEINVLRSFCARNGSPSTPFAARLHYRLWRRKSTGSEEKVTPAFSRAIRNLRRQAGVWGSTRDRLGCCRLGRTLLSMEGRDCACGQRNRTDPGSTGARFPSMAGCAGLRWASYATASRQWENLRQRRDAGEGATTRPPPIRRRPHHAQAYARWPG